ncbi:MAG: 6-hydroxymethylpterin diphosphokinase MptE-like protein [Christensenellales bacterium]
MRITTSLLARRRAHQLQHFELTKWGKNLKKLCGKFMGKRCFIIGNGPSLRAGDLDKLRDEYSFAFNRIYYIFEHTSWRPTFYCTQDVKIAQASFQEIRDAISTPYLFAPINLKWYEGVDIDTDFFFSPRPAGDRIPDFSENIAAYIGIGNTVAYTAIQLAVYMGFSELYLLGVDHSFQTYQDKDGNVIFDPSVKNYFCDQYNHDNEQLYVPKLDLSTLAFIAAQSYAESHPVTIYNATRGGKLEVFPRVDFDSLFDKGNL